MFPFTLNPIERERYVENPRGFLETFRRFRPNNLSWYAYSVTIVSPTDLIFIVYGMRDYGHGGIGEEIARLPVKVGPHVAHHAILAEARALAADRRRVELMAEEEEILKRYTAEILKESGV